MNWSGVQLPSPLLPWVQDRLKDGRRDPAPGAAGLQPGQDTSFHHEMFSCSPWEQKWRSACLLLTGVKRRQQCRVRHCVYSIWLLYFTVTSKQTEPAYTVVAHAARSCLFCGGGEDLQSRCCPKDYHPTDGEGKNYTQQSKVTRVVALPEHVWMVYFSLSLPDRLLCLSSSRMAAAD